MKAKIWNYSKWIKETNAIELKKHCDKLLIESGFTILGFIEYNFKPFGYSVLWLLAESHLAIHTFPEENKSYIELSSCVKEYYDNFKLKI
jgi:S-adenosylmethionine decarboxylase